MGGGSRTSRFWAALLVGADAIVMPETIDAIRAITGIVENANESIAKTNTALGIETTFA